MRVDPSTPNGIAVVRGRLITDLRILAGLINDGTPEIGREALAALASLQTLRSERPTCLCVTSLPPMATRRWRARVVDIVERSGTLACTSHGIWYCASRLYAWNEDIEEAWVDAHGDRVHRLDGPALKRTHGEEWWRGGRRHRTEGPAIMSTCDFDWYLHGRLHRDDGPASIVVKGGQVTAWWSQNGFLEATVEVSPRKYERVLVEGLNDLYRRGDYTQLRPVEGALPLLLADPANRRAVLEFLSSLTGGPSAFVDGEAA